MEGMRRECQEPKRQKLGSNSIESFTPHQRQYQATFRYQLMFFSAFHKGVLFEWMNERMSEFLKVTLFKHWKSLGLPRWPGHPQNGTHFFPLGSLNMLLERSTST